MQHPMTNVLVSLQIGGEDLTLVHHILSSLCDIDWSLNRASELKLVSLNWDDTDEWHFDDQLFRQLIVEAVLLHVPSGALKVDSLNVGSCLKSLLDIGWIGLLGHNRVQERLIKRPYSGTASGLEEGSQVGLWNVESRQPDDLWLLNLNPILVLVVPLVEVLHPGDEALLTLWGLVEPRLGHESIEDAVGKLVKIGGHTDFSDQCSL